MAEGEAVYEGFRHGQNRNLVFIGHGGCGKTSLVGGILFHTGMTTRLGKVDEGNSVTDFDEDEIARKVSIRSALAFCEHDRHKINLLDTPGYMAFVQSAREAVRVADTGVVVVDAIAGVEVQTEKVWSFADEFALPRIIVINKMDRENADFERALANVQEIFGRSAVPVQIPIGQARDFRGVIDLVAEKAYLFKADESGKFDVADIPADLKDDATARREALIEMIAESDEALMSKFFEQGSLPEEDLLAGLKKAILARTLVPVLCTAATQNFGTAQLLDAAVKFLPSPADRGEIEVIDIAIKEIVKRPVGAGTAQRGVCLPHHRRPVRRPHLHLQGVLRHDPVRHPVYNVNTETQERLGSLQVMQGKTPAPISEARAGDIVAVAKLKATQSGHTLADSAKPVLLPQPGHPELGHQLRGGGTPRAAATRKRSATPWPGCARKTLCSPFSATPRPRNCSYPVPASLMSK